MNIILSRNCRYSFITLLALVPTGNNYQIQLVQTFFNYYEKVPVLEFYKRRLALLKVLIFAPSAFRRTKFLMLRNETGSTMIQIKLPDDIYMCQVYLYDST